MSNMEVELCFWALVSLVAIAGMVRETLRIRQ